MAKTLKVVQHKLSDVAGESVTYSPTPRVGGKLDPRFVIIHFTVGRSAEAAAAWLSRKSAGPSAHMVVGRDGSIIQLAPLDRTTFHCGPSRWGELEGLDPYSIGIELDNAGPMTRKGGKWVFKFGGTFPDKDVVEAEHKDGGPYTAWHAYSKEQIEALVSALRGIVETYDIEEILGHDDISPGRKWDPGPAFPMQLVRKRVFGKELAEKDKKTGKRFGKADATD